MQEPVKLNTVGRLNFYVGSGRGRLIQTKSTNFTGGKDTVTNQYDFSGKLLRTLVCHGKGVTNPQQYRVLTKIEDDAAGRLTYVYKKAGNSPEVMITENKYDELGQYGKPRKNHRYRLCWFIHLSE